MLEQMEESLRIVQALGFDSCIDFLWACPWPMGFKWLAASLFMYGCCYNGWWLGRYIGRGLDKLWPHAL